MKLVDTSAWVHSLRPDGDIAVTARVRGLLEMGEAAWCAQIRLELWNGARGEHEKRVLREMQTGLPDLPIDASVWNQACDLARQARDAGVTLPVSDILIAACARHHAVDIEHSDTHFDTLARFPSFT